jgi:hypothetical protein
MDPNKRDQQHDKRDQREMPQDQNRDLGNQRNEEETGKPLQLDKDGKEHQGGKDHQGQQPPPNPQTEQHKPDQGQRTGQR